MLQYLGNADYLKTFSDFGLDSSQSLGAACPGFGIPDCTLGIDLFRRPAVASSNPDTQWTYRIDYTPRSADTFTARYLHDRSVLTPDFFTQHCGAAARFRNPTGRSLRAWPKGSWTHVFTSNLLNEFRVAETRLSYFFMPISSAALSNPLYKAPTIVNSDISDLGFNQKLPAGPLAGHVPVPGHRLMDPWS